MNGSSALNKDAPDIFIVPFHEKASSMDQRAGSPRHCICLDLGLIGLLIVRNK
jgi:hypothetical protein